jgi:hypothetical protein
MPAARHSYAIAQMNGYVYIMGGMAGNAGSAGTNTVFYAKINADGTITSWNTAASTHLLPSTLRWVTGTAANGYLYTVGGDVGGSQTANVYYASVSRVQIAGSLDLVGINGGDLSDPGSGGTLTAGDTNIVGALAVQGDANFAQSVGIAGDLSVGGKVAIRSSTNSTTAFQIQNAAGDGIFNAFYDSGDDASVLQLGYGVTGGYINFSNNNTSKWLIGMEGSGTCGAADTLYFYTQVVGGCALQLNSNGQVTFKAVNGASAYSIQNQTGGSLLNIDSSGNAITLFGGVTGGTLTTDIAGTMTHNAVCHSGGASANANVQFVACASGTVIADYAEDYPVASGASYGDIVATGTNMVNTYNSDIDGNADWSSLKGQITQLVKSAAPYQTNAIGIISDNPNSGGQNIKPEDNPMPIALNGRVPVNMAPDSPAIAPGDYITTSGTSVGKGMKATQAGFVIGKALEAWNPASGQTQVMVFVEPGYWPGPTNAGYLQNGGSADFSSLNVSGTATINNLSVTTLNATAATIGTLTVTGSAQFAGDITVGGHVITAGGQPTAESQAAIGTGASVAVDGTDTTGTITISTGANPTSGDLAKILFSKTYGKAPHIVLSPSNNNAAGLRTFKGATTSTDFMFDSLDNPAPNTTYTFDYFIAQ